LWTRDGVYILIYVDDIAVTGTKQQVDEFRRLFPWPLRRDELLTAAPLKYLGLQARRVLDGIELSAPDHVGRALRAADELTYAVQHALPVTARDIRIFAGLIGWTAQNAVVTWSVWPSLLLQQVSGDSVLTPDASERIRELARDLGLASRPPLVLTPLLLHNRVEVFVDASLNSSRRRGMLGTVLCVNEVPIYWHSALGARVATSSSMGEAQAVLAGVGAAHHVRRYLASFGDNSFAAPSSAVVYTDSADVLFQVRSRLPLAPAAWINADILLFLREEFQSTKAPLMCRFVPGKQNPADALTKPTGIWIPVSVAAEASRGATKENDVLTGSPYTA
jgi:hypothetical protein